MRRRTKTIETPCRGGEERGRMMMQLTTSNQSPQEDEMTYKELLDALLQMNDSQLRNDVTVKAGGEDEFFPAFGIFFADEKNNKFDKNHTYIAFDARFSTQ
jgi:hypothetical protein